MLAPEAAEIGLLRLVHIVHLVHTPRDERLDAPGLQAGQELPKRITPFRNQPRQCAARGEFLVGTGEEHPLDAVWAKKIGRDSVGALPDMAADHLGSEIIPPKEVDAVVVNEQPSFGACRSQGSPRRHRRRGGTKEEERPDQSQPTAPMPGMPERAPAYGWQAS